MGRSVKNMNPSKSTFVESIEDKVRKKDEVAGNDFMFKLEEHYGREWFYFIFFRTHFTAAWVFLLLRMQNGEKIKDFIIHFHFLTVKVSQMDRISVKFSGYDYNKSSVF